MQLLVPALAAHSAVNNAQRRPCGEQWLALPFRWSRADGREEGEGKVGRSVAMRRFGFMYRFCMVRGTAPRHA
jgi:hypothetical protein